MQQTIAKVRSLEKFIEKYGEDAVISQSLTKIAQYKIHQYDSDIKKLRHDLARLERKYNKKSEAFMSDFTKGKAGDDMDFIEWASLYNMLGHIEEKKTELERAI